ncbi:MAG: hypothetical protein ACXQTS_00355 [Candidatus Methanospirareceae archaeon]
MYPLIGFRLRIKNLSDGYSELNIDEIVELLKHQRERGKIREFTYTPINVKQYMMSQGFKSNGEIDIKGFYGGGKFGDIMDSLFRNIWGLTDVGSHTGRSKMKTMADMEYVYLSDEEREYLERLVSTGANKARRISFIKTVSGSQDKVKVQWRFTTKDARDKLTG